MQRSEVGSQRDLAVDLPGTAAGRAVASILAGVPASRSDEASSASNGTARRSAGIAPVSRAAAAAEVAAVALASRGAASRSAPASTYDRFVVAWANRLVATCVGRRLRLAYHRHALGWRIGRGATVDRGLEIHGRSGRVEIGDGAHLGAGCLLLGAGEGDLVVGDGVTIGARAIFVLSAERGDDPESAPLPAPIQIERGACVGPNAIILGGVVLGEGSVIAAGAVVIRSVPAYAIVAGNPADVVGERPRESTSEQGWLFH